MPYDGSGLDETTKVLIEARRLVEEGWCQGAYEDVAGRVCLIRAIGKGSLVSDIAGSGWRGAYMRVDALIPEGYFGVGGNKLYPWKDAPGRTQAEVLALLDRAIAGDAEP